MSRSSLVNVVSYLASGKVGPVKWSLRPLRLYVFNKHVHHGFIGLCLLAHDRRDWKYWISDLIH